MDNKDNLDGSSTNDDPGFRSNSNTSNTQQVVSDTHESRVSPYLVTRDPSLKPAGEVTNTMDKDGLWCDGPWTFICLVEKDILCKIMTITVEFDLGSL